MLSAFIIALINVLSRELRDGFFIVSSMCMIQFCMLLNILKTFKFERQVVSPNAEEGLHYYSELDFYGI